MSIARLMQMARAGVPAGGGDVWTDPDLANASYDSVSFSVAGQGSTPQDIYFKPDGLQMYVVDAADDEINEYSLSTAWDISTASYVQNFSVSSQESNPTGLDFSPDGVKLYIVGAAGDEINEYSLSTAWDISTASYVQNFSVSSQDGNSSGLRFKPDGTKVFVVGTNSDAINEYSLSTAWDISTASYVQNFSVSSQDGNPTGLYFNPDGTKVFVVGLSIDAVFQYSLSTAWDISTASYDSVSSSVVSQDNFPAGLYFKSDGAKMYIIGSFGSENIYQYSTA